MDPCRLEALVEERIASGQVELPVFPSSAQEVLSLCDAEDVDHKKLAATIRRDATLAGHFLSLANSAAFGARVPLVSLQQALSRLGVNQTKRIALVVACKTRAFVIPGRPERASEILGHALATGMFAQEVARRRRRNVEEAFLCGLLHDIGRPAVLQLCGEIMLEAGEASVFTDTAPSREVEACASRLHERVGGMIARLWTMPKAVIDVIEHHHADLARGGDADANAAVVQLADALAHGHHEGRTGDGGQDAELAALSAHPAANILNLYPEDLEALIAARPTIREQAQA